jgi:lipoate-protein ligase A
MVDEWRLLDTGLLTAAENMALDDVLLECRANDVSPNTVRFLRFDPQAVLVGFHQSVGYQVREEFCQDNGIEINRRITGGGTIYFNKESLGWEVIASKKELAKNNPMFNSRGIFEKMCEGVIEGLHNLGVKAEFKSRNDIEVDGRKISGTGGTERDDAFLFQGTLLIDFDADTMLHSLKVPLEKLKDKEIDSVKERVTCVKWVLGYTPDMDTIKTALKKGFEKAFGIKLVEHDLTREERGLLIEKLPRYQSQEWIYGERTPLEDVAEVHALRKTKGGLVRTSLTLDLPTGMIKNALITGDFFIFPSRAILELENLLRGTRCEDKEIEKTVHEFFETGVQVPDITPEDFIDLIIEAANKTKYTEYGVTIQEANSIYTINNDADTIFDNQIDVLLLPYCSKLVSCELRFTDGCTACGQCTVGVGYKMAQEHGLTPIIIQNFEHLMETIRTMEGNGSTGYLGCCCEGFYSKHREDFESVNLPGVLINIDDQTCYDLGKENEAYAGKFENQTNLRLELLEKMITNYSLRSNA